MWKTHPLCYDPRPTEGRAQDSEQDPSRGLDPPPSGTLAFGPVASDRAKGFFYIPHPTPSPNHCLPPPLDVPTSLPF